MIDDDLKKLSEGDMSCFEDFYEKTKKKVFYNIFAILKDETLSEEALQETYVRFLYNVSKLKKEKNALGYLFKISRNVSLDLIKKEKKNVNIDEYLLTHYEKEETENFDILDLAKKILKPKEFEIIILHIVEDMSHKEIAKLLHRPLGTILWAYNNALKKLKKGMEKNGRERNLN